MPLFTLMCFDKPNALDLRMATREAHLAYVRENLAMVKLAGPMLDADDGMAGSLFVVAGKRHGEFLAMGEDRATTRASLASYSLAYLRYVWMLASSVGIVAYCLWAFEQSHARGFPWFELSIVPFVLALLRYALIIETGRADAPEEVLLGDRVFLVLVASWLVVYGAGLHGAR